jgi:hypothetical protein
MSGLSKVDRLRAACKVAPYLRDGARLRTKPFLVYDHEVGTSKVIRQESASEVLRRVSDGAGVVLDIHADDPRAATCLVCGRLFLVKDAVSRRLGDVKVAKGSRGHPKLCAICSPEPQEACAGFGGKCPDKAPVPKYAKSVGQLVRRNGAPWRCRACACRLFQSTKTPEERREIAMTRKNARSPEDRSNTVRKGHASRSPESRAGHLQKWHAGAAAMTREQRRRARQKQIASTTAEQRHAAAIKGAETFRRKKAASR